ncbi:MAG: glutamate--tRNA ligase [Patescibacteria group bacterium]
MTVRTRMAPSPTGDIHVGSMSIVLKNYAFAKKNQGKFVLRIEDTDQEREVEGATKRIQSIIRDYGLDWDEGPDKGGPYAPYIQSERLSIYKEHADQLISTGKAYYCFCSKERLAEVHAQQLAAKTPPMYDRHCRSLSSTEVAEKLNSKLPYVIRLRVPDNQTITFTDLIRGKIEVQSAIIDDQVLLKSDGFPTYHLAVVVDDYLMKITHIMRGEEWISSTPKHVLLYQAYGWEQPIYAHIPIFLNPDGKGKMSKRKGTVSAQSFLDAGYLPEAMLNFFMILGWGPKDQREILTLDEYIQEFDPKDISAKSVVFDLKKLDWINGMYIRKLSLDELKKRLQPFIPTNFPTDKIDHILPLVSERLVKLSEFDSLTDFFYKEIQTDHDLLVKKSTSEEVSSQLNQTIQVVESLDKWSPQKLEEDIRQLQEKQEWKKSQYFMMLRLAITGKQATPPLFETMIVIGKEVCLKRLTASIPHNV